MATKQISKLKTHGEVLAEEITRDEDFRAEWERLALAREVAAELVRYRSQNDLSQRALAERLGVSQPRVAKLESGEHNPDVDTLVRISRATGLEFAIDIAPTHRTPKLVTKQVRDRRSTYVDDGVSVIAAVR
ncbi:MAG: helix-turn-helix domain-containing protein [Thermoanaerobaculia bacterium]